MKKINFRGAELEVPESVGELTAVQYEYFLILVQAVGAGAIDAKRMRVRWLSFLLGMGMSDYTILVPELIAEAESLAHVADGFYRDGAPCLSTPLNKLPEYDGHTGPGDWLDGLKFGDFVKCLTIMESVQQASAEEIADGCEEVARTLYGYAPAEQVPDMLTYHATVFFMSVWNEIMSAPVTINGKPVDFRIIFKGDGSGKGGEKPDDNTGWTGIAFEVAKEGPFGKLREVEATDFWEVLLYLYRCKFEYIHSC